MFFGSHQCRCELYLDVCMHEHVDRVYSIESKLAHYPNIKLCASVLMEVAGSHSTSCFILYLTDWLLINRSYKVRLYAIVGAC